MALSINSTSGVETNTETAHAIKTAQLAKSQAEIEGQMALDLIASASLESLPQPVGNVGQTINVKV